MSDQPATEPHMRAQRLELPQLLQSRFAYIPAIDGLRALAVLAVLLYHADLPWMPGGFVGVDIFFVISGYLITGILLSEWDRSNHLDLHAFWLRRAYRLVPAMVAVLLAALLVSALFLPETIAQTRAGALAGLLYVSNWHLIINHQSYFDLTDRPPLLRHLWSLAVEGQMYLIWPLVMAWLLPRGRRVVLAAAIGAALTSAILIAVLFQPDTDPSHVYYGTETRAFGLLAGAALALLLRPVRPARSKAGLLDLFGIGLLLAIGAACALLNEFDPLTYQAGLAGVVVLTTLLISVVLSGRAGLTERLLSLRPLRWLGLRSYSVYLWHWPIYVLTRPEIDLPYDRTVVLAIRLVATLICAELSYVLIERPIRRRAQRRLDATAAPRVLQRQSILLVSTLFVIAMLVGVSTIVAPAGIAASTRDTPEITEQSIYLASTAAPTRMRPTLGLDEVPTRPIRPSPTAPRAPVEPTATDDAILEAAPATPTATPEPTATPTAPESVLVIGDSVMVGAARELQKDIAGQAVEIDAAVGRQMKTTIAILGERREAHNLGTTVVIHIGNNGPITTRQFDDLMAQLSDVPHVIIVNLKVPRRWQDPNNAILSDGVARYPNATLLDWYDASHNHAELFWHDGLHLRPAGQRFFAKLLIQAIESH